MSINHNILNTISNKMQLPTIYKISTFYAWGHERAELGEKHVYFHKLENINKLIELLYDDDDIFCDGLDKYKDNKYCFGELFNVISDANSTIEALKEIEQIISIDMNINFDDIIYDDINLKKIYKKYENEIYSKEDEIISCIKKYSKKSLSKEIYDIITDKNFSGFDKLDYGSRIIHISKIEYDTCIESDFESYGT